MSKVQRFKPHLTSGNWHNNPETLVRDDAGDFVKYEDYKNLEDKMKKLCDLSTSEIFYVGMYRSDAEDAVHRLKNFIEREQI